ncbi:unnamed protein product [Protopolystoma xenopodis]|uniref:Secreted protein n=1 Tax=Protopolystoma xenopodis TaxID=117903 RepID=A0A3S5CM33_9PLAT|nr:unnamed protein product [Protopolystoma xenopodis]
MLFALCSLLFALCLFLAEETTRLVRTRDLRLAIAPSDGQVVPRTGGRTVGPDASRERVCVLSAVHISPGPVWGRSAATGLSKRMDGPPSRPLLATLDRLIGQFVRCAAAGRVDFALLPFGQHFRLRHLHFGFGDCAARRQVCALEALPDPS